MTARTVFKYLFLFVLLLLFFLVGLFGYFKSKDGQKRLSTFIFTQLSSNLGTKVKGYVQLEVPKSLTFNDLLIFDLEGDTLLFVPKARAGLDMFAVLNNKIKLSNIEIEGAKIRLIRTDSLFNFEKVLLNIESSPNSKPFLYSLNTAKFTNSKLKYVDSLSSTDLNINLGWLSTSFSKMDVAANLYDLSRLELAKGKIIGKLGNLNSSSGKSTSQLKFGVIDIDDLDVELRLLASNKLLSLKTLKSKISKLEVRHGDWEFDAFKLLASKSDFSNVGAKPSQVFNPDFVRLQDVEISTGRSFQNAGKIVVNYPQCLTKEPSGNHLVLKALDFSKDGSHISSKKMEVQFNQSSIQLDLQGSKSMVFDIKNSRLEAKDGLFFAPELAKNPYFKAAKGDVFVFNGKIQTVADGLVFKQSNLIAPRNTYARFEGFYKNNGAYEINVVKAHTEKSDFEKYYKNESVNLPKAIDFSGSIAGTNDKAQVKFTTTSELGTATIKAEYNIAKQQYVANIGLVSFEAGVFSKNEDLGLSTGSFRLQSGAAESLQLQGNIKDLIFQGEHYQNTDLKANIKDKRIKADIAIAQEGLSLNWNGDIDLTEKDPKINGISKISQLNLKAFGLTDKDINLSGDLILRKLELNADNPILDIEGKKLFFSYEGKKYPLETIVVDTKKTEKGKLFKLSTPFMNTVIEGDFNYNSIVDEIKTEIHRYYKIPNYTPKNDFKRSNLSFESSITYDSLFRAFLPGLQHFDPFTLSGAIATGTVKPIELHTNIGSVTYDSIAIKDIKINASGNSEQFTYNLTVSEVLKDKFRIRNANIDGKVENDVAEFNLAIKDSLQQNIHSLKTYVTGVKEGIKLSFDESGTVLSYIPWAGNPYGSIEISDKGILINNVVFTSGEQLLILRAFEHNTPLSVFAENIDLNQLSRSFLRDSTLVSGVFNMDFEINDYRGTPSFEGDFFIKDFTYKNQALGKVYGVAKRNTNGDIGIETKLKSDKQEAALTGTFKPNDKGALDLDLDFSRLDLSILKLYLENNFDHIEGNLNGKISISGNTEKPTFEGDATVERLSLKSKETGATFLVNNQSLKIKGEKIILNDFKIEDKNQNLAHINGLVNISKLPDYSYDFTIKSADFNVLDAVEGYNPLYYGTVNIDSELKIKGRNLKFLLTGDVVLNPKTKFTLITEQESALASELEQLITFKANQTAISKNEKKNFDFSNSVNINLELKKEAQISLLMDAVTGDIMTVNGQGKLNVGYDNKGDLYIIGKYDIVSGVYNLTFQVLQKEFLIKSNSESYLLWNGDPMAATIKIQAEHNVPGKKTIQIDDFKQQVPVRVDLGLSGNLSEPKVVFDLVLNESDLGKYKEGLEAKGFSFIGKDGKKEIKDRDASLTNDLNNKAIMMLMTGTLSSDDLISSFSKTGNIEDLARQRVSELISNQLGKYTDQLIKGVDIDLGLESKGTSVNANTNLSLGLSKMIFNDRLILQVGKNFELENSKYKSDQIFDNVKADWLITKDGRYRFNVFRKNLNQLVIEGNVVETGLGFVIAIDYETWRKLMKK